jgi:hypothetical protein
MKIEDAIKSAMARMIEKNKEIAGVEVQDWSEEYDKYAFGGCETCGPEYEEEYTVYISYTTPETNSWSASYTYKGKFTDLIKELDT